MKEFVDFLMSLAPEGETVLLVKQSPRRVNGALQFHADGAVKCTWPAFLPADVRARDGDSWYANTASFVLDRLDPVSASAANCEYCLVLVLDDVGTKSAEPPLAPTWVMETSPGSFQWGYAFTEQQPTKAEFAAAIKAIADAGYTDPGALNPVRNFRVPGSVNLKPGREAFRARLVAFEPDRLFTLGQICDALKVTPAEPDLITVGPIKVADPGGDDVLAWLSEAGLVLRKANAEGWVGVMCPNASAHTDGNPEGRYLPASRAYCCLHSHCIDFDTRAFLGWVADNGGPAHEPGLRDDLIAATMTRALAQIEPSEFFTDDAEAVIEAVNQRELGRVEKNGWFERFAYVQNDDAYFDLTDRREISRPTFNALYRHISCRSVHTGRRVEASVSFDELRQTMGARAVLGITYAAGESVLVARDGDAYGNRWRDARPTPGSGDVTPWLEHCEALLPVKAEREHIWDVMAYKTQHPEVKINHAVLHGGDQGCGKDTLWAPFLWAVCGPGLKNRGLMDNDTLGSQWGYQLECEVLIINELREPEARERRALANKLKPLIAAPPDLLVVNRKGLAPYDMLNRLLVLAFTNDPVPITIDSQDRRWYCVWSSAPRMNPDAAWRLWEWYKDKGGFEAISGWLHRRDVSRFNPSRTPPWTEFKASLIEQGMSISESYLVDMLRGRRGEFAKGVIGSPFYALCDRLAGSAPSGVKVPQAALLHAVKEAGWIDLGRVASSDLPTKKHLWCAPDMAQVSKSDLRRMVEDAPPVRLTSVK